MLDVNTMKVSRVTAKIAGMESIAKSTSVLSIRMSTASSGVASHLPSTRVKNL